VVAPVTSLNNWQVDVLLDFVHEGLGRGSGSCFRHSSASEEVANRSGCYYFKRRPCHLHFSGVFDVHESRILSKHCKDEFNHASLPLPPGFHGRLSHALCFECDHLLRTSSNELLPASIRVWPNCLLPISSQSRRFSRKPKAINSPTSST